MDYYKMSSQELIRELEKRDGELADALEDSAEVNKRLGVVTGRLEEVADILADKGMLVNTPGWKKRWIEEGVGIEA